MKSPAVRLTRRTFVRSLLAGSALAFAPNIWAKQIFATHAEGFVFHDRGGLGQRQRGDRGIAGVAVSNGREVCVTDKNGRWRLPIEDEQTTFFVIKPRNWATPLNKQNLPRFYYTHQPAGSPKQKFAGVAPTGPLPASIDFPLIKREEPDRFKAVICGDPQPRNLREVNYLARSIVPQLAGVDAKFGVSLGDITFDDLDLFEPLNEAMGLVGIPWHNVIGNHDLNFDAPNNRHANESFRRVYGTTYYAFDVGPVHFILLNNVEWMGRPTDPHAAGAYRRMLGERQLAFIENDLKVVPRDHLVVLLFHIPLDRGYDPAAAGPMVQDRQALYRLIEKRPHTLSFSAHTHSHNHLFLGAADGWNGAQPHHHVNTGALCGSWFAGAPDVHGIPHGTMADGTPRGYLEVEFNGSRYNIDGYRVLQKPADHQMNITVPAQLSREQLGTTGVFANVFNGSVRSKVRMRCGAGDQWREMEKAEVPDPHFVHLAERDLNIPDPYRRLPAPRGCSHLWRGSLPSDLPAGTHVIEVVTTDMFGNQHREVQPFRVV